MRMYLYLLCTYCVHVYVSTSCVLQIAVCPARQDKWEWHWAELRAIQLMRYEQCCSYVQSWNSDITVPKLSQHLDLLSHDLILSINVTYISTHQHHHNSVRMPEVPPYICLRCPTIQSSQSQ